jgi:hypothetical protein
MIENMFLKHVFYHASAKHPPIPFGSVFGGTEAVEVGIVNKKDDR